MVLLAHTSHDPLLRTRLDAAALLLGAVRDAPSAPHRHLEAPPLELAALPFGAVGAAQSSLLDVLGAARVGTLLASGTVGDAATPLYDAVGAPGGGTRAAGRRQRVAGSRLLRIRRHLADGL